MTTQVEVIQDRELNKPRLVGTWYRPDGLAIPGLPVDAYHQELYTRKGWSLAPPAPTATPQVVAEPAAPAEEVVVKPLPPHMHVFSEPSVGAPCLVAGCQAARMHPQVKRNKKNRGGQ